MLFPEWSTAVFFLVIVVHESLTLLHCLLFFRKILKFFGFPAFLCIWTLSNNGSMILRSIFSHREQLRDSFTTITEDSNTHWCSRRKIINNLQILQGVCKLLTSTVYTNTHNTNDILINVFIFITHSKDLYNYIMFTNYKYTYNIFMKKYIICTYI